MEKLGGYKNLFCHLFGEEPRFIDDYFTDEMDIAITSLHQFKRSGGEKIFHRDLEILQYRFGLLGERSYLCREVGERFNITKCRVQQVEAKLLRILRQNCIRHLRRYL